MDLVNITYQLVSTLAILVSFLCFLVTFNTAFHEKKSLFYKFKIKEINKLIKDRPIRSGLTAISFLMFFSVISSFFVYEDITVSFVIGYSFSRIPLLLASAIILWTVVEIDIGEWVLNVNGKDNGV